MKKTILITGASSSKKTARLFQSKGWNVSATMRSPEKEKELNQLENVWVAKLDVLDNTSIKKKITERVEKFGKIDVLLNKAGYGAYGPMETFSSEKIARLFNTNVIGLLEMTKSIIPHFKENKEGVLINISSMGGLITFPLGSLYPRNQVCIRRHF